MRARERRERREGGKTLNLTSIDKISLSQFQVYTVFLATVPTDSYYQ